MLSDISILLQKYPSNNITLRVKRRISNKNIQLENTDAKQYKILTPRIRRKIQGGTQSNSKKPKLDQINSDEALLTYHGPYKEMYHNRHMEIQEKTEHLHPAHIESSPHPDNNILTTPYQGPRRKEYDIMHILDPEQQQQKNNNKEENNLH